MPMLVRPALPAGSLCNRDQPVISDARLVLRPWDATDADAVRAVYSDPAIQRWHTRTMVDAAEARAWIADRHARWDAERGADWAVTEDEVLVGRVGLNGLDLHEAVAEPAYWVTPAARGREVAVRALALLTAWTFDELDLHRLEVHHSVANPASCRVAEKSGYPLEGTRRESVRHADGWHDMHVHARLAEA